MSYFFIEEKYRRFLCSYSEDYFMTGVTSSFIPMNEVLFIDEDNKTEKKILTLNTNSQE